MHAHVKFFSKRDGLFAWENFHPFWQGQSATSAPVILVLGYIKDNIFVIVVNIDF